MRSTFLTLLTGWLISTWVQVPSPLQEKLKSAADWIKTVIEERLNDPSPRDGKDAPPSVEKSVKPEEPAKPTDNAPRMKRTIFSRLRSR